MFIREKSKYASKFTLTGFDKLQFPLYIDKVGCKGKKIIFYCKDNNKQTIYLVSFLATEGSWRYTPANNTSIELKIGIYIYKDLIWLKEITAYNDDSLKRGNFNICFNDSELAEVMKDVGPDLLAEEISFETYKTVARQKFLTNKCVAYFIKEQKFFSGIGNYLRAETLYDAKISPQRLVSQLSDDELYRIYYFSIKNLRESYQHGGLTVRTYWDPKGRKGTFPVKIYMKDKDPFGNPVHTMKLSDFGEIIKDGDPKAKTKQTVHYVPNIQH